ncbi:MAG: ion transporter, partial [Alphaproteobacteria bacterium]
MLKVQDKTKSARQRVYEALENPKSLAERSLAGSLVALIFASICTIVIEARSPTIFERYRIYFDAFDLFVLLCFSIEYIARLWSYPRARDYTLSWYGAIDLAAIVPSALCLFLATPYNLAGLRVLRLLRLLRALKLVQQTQRSSALWSGILARVAPFMGVALACKTLLLYFEAQDWWIGLDNLGPIIAMIGYAIGVLLGSK